MIDTEHEPLLSPSQAARLVLPNGTHVNTIRRWINKGLKGVRLEFLAIGGNIYTSEAALGRFFETITALRADDVSQDSPTSTPKSRESAKKLLDEVLG